MQPFFPPGTVIAFAGQINQQTYLCGADNYSPTLSNNTGWILCDGSALTASIFPELFSCIGYLYGGYNDSFNLPDYRGYFLRGLAVNSTQDPGLNNRTAAVSGMNYGVGSTQRGMVQQHGHQYNAFPVQQGQGGQYSAGATISHQQNATTTGLSDGNSNLSGEEPRPKNIYVNYLIYAGLPVGGQAV
nr:phage tail protein [Mucilaginibacter sp. L294]